MTSGPRRRTARRRARLTFFVISLACVLLFCLVLILQQPWQQKVRVLTASIPSSGYTVELWEKPYWYFGAGYEYQTWFVVRSPSERSSWHLIDEQYITFRSVRILLSPDHTTVRVETDGDGEAFHMIAEYDLSKEEFKAQSEPGVLPTSGWIVLSAARIR